MLVSGLEWLLLIVIWGVMILGGTAHVTSLSPEQALQMAKMMVLPLNDSLRQHTMDAYGKDKVGMENMISQWMREHADGHFLQPVEKVPVNITEEYFGLNKLLPSPPRPHDGNAQKDISKMKLDLPGASFWDVKDPISLPKMQLFTRRSTKVLRQYEGESLGGTSVPPTPLHTPASQSIHDTINRMMSAHHPDVGMYEYQAPSWEQMPTLLVLQSTTPTEASAEITTASTLFPQESALHPAVVRARELMSAHSLRHLSAFIAAFCEILRLHKTPERARELLIGVLETVDDEIQSTRLVHLGQDILYKIEEYSGLLSQYPPDEMEALLDATHHVFLNHSYFANDSREVLDEIESWYTHSEGEALLETLISVDLYPNEGKTYKQVMEKVLKAALHPYYRMGNSDRRAALIVKLEIVLYRARRRSIKSNLDIFNKRKTQTTVNYKTIARNRKEIAINNLDINKNVIPAELDDENVTDNDTDNEEHEVNENSENYDLKANTHKNYKKQFSTKQSFHANVYLKLNENYTEKNIQKRFKQNYKLKSGRNIGFRTNFDKLNNTNPENIDQNHIISYSSYSDEEFELKDRLKHADINDKLINRRQLGSKREKSLLDGTSESDEEGVLKTNIYKVFGSFFK